MPVGAVIILATAPVLFGPGMPLYRLTAYELEVGLRQGGTYLLLFIYGKNVTFFLLKSL